MRFLAVMFMAALFCSGCWQTGGAGSSNNPDTDADSDTDTDSDTDSETDTGDAGAPQLFVYVVNQAGGEITAPYEIEDVNENVVASATESSSFVLPTGQQYTVWFYETEGYDLPEPDHETILLGGEDAQVVGMYQYQ